MPDPEGDAALKALGAGVFEALSRATEDVELTPGAQWAVDWWLQLEGYRPERLPVFAALYEIGDVDELLVYLRVIRDTLKAPRGAP